MKKCKTCSRQTDKLVAMIYKGKLYSGCESCLYSKVLPAELSAKYDREWQKKEYRRELTQPNQKSFAKAYPDKFRETHGDQAYRKYG